ncbi:MAG: RNA recognition motif domain-containing protein [Candidatus Binatia bacterium]
MATKLFVGNLPFSMTTGDLEGLFGQVGSVSSVNIIMDKFTGRSRGFGFVEMSSDQEAQAAIERFNGYDIQGRALTVNEAKPQEPRSGGGRSFGGGGGGGGGGRGRSYGDRGGGGGGGGGGGRERRW